MTISPVRTPPPGIEIGTRRTDPATAPDRATAASAPPAVPAQEQTDETKPVDPRPTLDATPGVLAIATSQLPTPPHKVDTIDDSITQAVDPRVGVLARQVPTEEWVRALKRLREAKGLFVNRRG